MEIRLQQEMQELMVQLERLQQVKLVPLVEMEVHLRGPLMVALEGYRRLALVGHLEIAVEGHPEETLEGHLRVARILQVGAERHLVAALALTAAPSPWMQPLLLTPASPRWCFYL